MPRSRFVAAAVLALSACAPRGLVVPASDPTAPEYVVLTVADPAGGLSLDTRRADRPIATTARASTVTVTATARDAESGVRELRVYARPMAGTDGPLLSSTVLAQVVRAEAGAGARVLPEARLVARVELARQLPENGPSALELWAEAVNFAGERRASERLVIQTR